MTQGNSGDTPDRFCENCGARFGAHGARCPSCGAALAQNARSPARFGLPASGAAALGRCTIT